MKRVETEKERVIFSGEMLVLRTLYVVTYLYVLKIKLLDGIKKNQ